jgi:hypothetical protein
MFLVTNVIRCLNDKKVNIMVFRRGGYTVCWVKWKYPLNNNVLFRTVDSDFLTRSGIALGLFQIYFIEFFKVYACYGWHVWKVIFGTLLTYYFTLNIKKILHLRSVPLKYSLRNFNIETLVKSVRSTCSTFTWFSFSRNQFLHNLVCEICRTIREFEDETNCQNEAAGP